jgi:uncharacterized protein YjbI with pentapeptide repeats
LTLAAIAAPPSAVLFARFLSGASWSLSIFLGVLAGLAVYLASKATTTEAKAAEVGRGVIVGLLVTIALAWVQHQGDEREKRESEAANRLAARQTLALSLSSGTEFVGIDLHGRDLAGFYLGGKDFSHADLHGANLRNAILRGATLNEANLRDADLAGADLREVKLNGVETDLRSASLVGADLTRAELRSVRLGGADLEQANLTGTNLQGADLRKANLRDAVMPGALLQRALLEADLRGAVLSADLRHAELKNVDLRDARWDATTRWPPGFDPGAHMAEMGKALVSPPVPSSARRDTVERVVDADTIVLTRLGGVRLVGIDAPQAELRPQDCFGSQASEVVRELLPPRREVRYTLGKDSRDFFNRALAYVWFAGGEFLNVEIIERGAAQVLITPPNVDHADLFRKAAVQAAIKRRGLWATC